MAESLGSLIDKLITTGIKQFMVQDLVHRAATSGEGLDAETTSNLVNLNLQRTNLINEINALTGDEQPIIKLLRLDDSKPQS